MNTDEMSASKSQQVMDAIATNDPSTRKPTKISSTTQLTQDAMKEESKMTKSIWTALICIGLFTFYYVAVITAIHKVLPFYVASSPENGWSISDLSIIYGVFYIGRAIASQTIMAAEYTTTHRMTFIVTGHYLQNILGVMAWIMMSSLLGFKLWMFYIGAFLGGFACDITVLEAYSTMISDDEEIQTMAVGVFGKVLPLAVIVLSLSLPPIYDYVGWEFVCCTVAALHVMGVVTVYVLKTGGGLKKELASTTHRMRSVHSRRLRTIEHKFSSQYSLKKLPSRSVQASVPHLPGIDSKVTSTATDVAEESTSNQASMRWWNVPTLMLMFVVTLDCLSFTIYCTSFALAFVDDFGIDSTVSGWLDAAGSVVSFVLITVFLKFEERSSLFRYPFDVTILIMVFLIGNILFAVFYAEWIAYSAHWIITRLPLNVTVAEMLSRLDLCPPSIFNKVTAITGFLKTGALLSGAILGPILFVVHHTLPFIVNVALNALILVSMGTVYCYRLRLLSAMEFDDDIKNEYLLKERAYLMRNESDEVKRADTEIIKETRRTLRRGVSYLDVLSLVN